MQDQYSRTQLLLGAEAMEKLHVATTLDTTDKESERRYHAFMEELLPPLEEMAGMALAYREQVRTLGDLQLVALGALLPTLYLALALAVLFTAIHSWVPFGILLGIAAVVGGALLVAPVADPDQLALGRRAAQRAEAAGLRVDHGSTSSLPAPASQGRSRRRRRDTPSHDCGFRRRGASAIRWPWGRSPLPRSARPAPCP